MRVAVFFLLFAAAIPWYWELAGLPPDLLVWGMPSWFVVAVLGSFLISVTAAWCLRRPWLSEQTVMQEESEQ